MSFLFLFLDDYYLTLMIGCISVTTSLRRWWGWRASEAVRAWMRSLVWWRDTEGGGFSESDGARTSW